MRLFMLTSMVIILLSSCFKKNEYDKKLTRRAYEKVSSYKNTILHGKVQRNNTDGHVQGYGNYWYGIKNGTWVDFYNNGLLKDSFFFRYDRKDGAAFHFDSSGRLEFRQNYLNDKAVGESSSYNNSGDLKEYIFKSFEGEIIFKIGINGSDTVQTGQLPYFRYDTVDINKTEKKLHLFLYLIYIPGIEMHYEIAKVENGRIISSEKITSDNCFYEMSRDMLEQPLHYAIVMSFFNKSKGRNNLTVNVLD